MNPVLAIGALLLLLSGSRKDEEKKKAPVAEPEPETPKPVEVSPLPLGGILTKIGELGAAGDAAWAVPASIAGVSTGFLVVVGLWALALVAGIVVSKMMGPEMDRRRTLGICYSAEKGTYVWRGARLMWAKLVAERLKWNVLELRWPELGVDYGEITVSGFLPVVVRPGEVFPKNADSYSPDDQYAVYRWPASRFEPADSVKSLSSEAHTLARIWAHGFTSACRAGAIARGELSTQSGPPTIDSLAMENAGLFCAEGGEFNGALPKLEEQRAFWLQGISDGCATMLKANTFGGKGAFQPQHQAIIAAYLAEWQPNFNAPKSQTGKQARFYVEGQTLAIANSDGDVTAFNVRVAQ